MSPLMKKLERIPLLKTTCTFMFNDSINFSSNICHPLVSIAWEKTNNSRFSVAYIYSAKIDRKLRLLKREMVNDTKWQHQKETRRRSIWSSHFKI
jgi:hypothetical protein